jgi:hypothetical protein
MTLLGPSTLAVLVILRIGDRAATRHHIAISIQDGAIIGFLVITAGNRVVSGLKIRLLLPIALEVGLDTLVPVSMSRYQVAGKITYSILLFGRCRQPQDEVRGHHMVDGALGFLKCVLVNGFVIDECLS